MQRILRLMKLFNLKRRRRLRNWKVFTPKCAIRIILLQILLNLNLFVYLLNRLSPVEVEMIRKLSRNRLSRIPPPQVYSLLLNLLWSLLHHRWVCYLALIFKRIFVLRISGFYMLIFHAFLWFSRIKNT